MALPLPPLNLALSEADNSRTAFGAVSSGSKEIYFPGASKGGPVQWIVLGVVALLAIGALRRLGA